MRILSVYNCRVCYKDLGNDLQSILVGVCSVTCMRQINVTYPGEATYRNMEKRWLSARERRVLSSLLFYMEPGYAGFSGDEIKALKEKLKD